MNGQMPCMLFHALPGLSCGLYENGLPCCTISAVLIFSVWYHHYVNAALLFYIAYI
jgi:hypothetical protein